MKEDIEKYIEWLIINKYAIYNSSVSQSKKRKKAIGLIGPMGGGKDTMAKQIIEEQKKDIITISFADEVRKMIFKTINFNPKTKKDYSNFKNIILESKENFSIIKPFSGRDMLINLGDGMRKEDSLFWIKRVHSNLNNIDSNTTIIFTDVRYINEAEYIMNNFEDVTFIFCAYEGEGKKMMLCPEIDSEKMACFFYYFKNKKHGDIIKKEELNMYKNILENY